ncbi:glycerate kinase [Luteococcus sp. Sow4_B9]|uniref:glycerate kinase n=1 Tax=Luteococcus sp. Sow4_B9 TaxID=3438792 RepID=UPI003F9C2A5C
MTRPTTIVLAPDSFKECLTAKQVCDALDAGLRSVLPQAHIIHVPMADGGEGTVQALVDATGGRVLRAPVSGPMGGPITASFGLLGDGATAVIEMAEASGLGLVPAGRRDPRRASSRGTGELVLAALDEGVRNIVLGLGGSATNDGGAGLATALGVRFLDDAGRELPDGGAALARLAHIDVSGMDSRVAETTFQVACDVSNPLCGPDGASAVFGPQKGADHRCVAELDAALAHYARIISEDLGKDVASRPGAGAAGGLGAGMVAFFDATLRRGIDIVIEHSGLEGRLTHADLVITGEGRIDGQTRFGKTPKGVADVAGEYGVPVIAVAGSLGEGVETLQEAGFAAVLPILASVGPLEEALDKAPVNLERTARNLAVLIQLGADFRGRQDAVPAPGEDV